MLIGDVVLKEFQTVDKSATVLHTIQVMTKNKSGFVVFVENQKVIGVLTERDLIEYLLLSKRESDIAFDYAKKEIMAFKEYRTVEHVLLSLIEFGFRRVIVVDKENNFKGVTTQEHLIHFIDKETYKVKMKLYHLNNLHPLITVDKDSTIQNAFEIMKEHSIGSAVVVDDNLPIGIITERDTIRIIEQNKNINNSIVSIMSSPIVYANIDSTIEDTLKTMSDNSIQRVLVKDGDEYKVLGIRDILNVIKGSYGSLLEKKLKEAKKVLNSIQEAIIEVELIDGEYIIHWGNKKSFELFGNSIIDNNVFSIIDCDLWENILEETTYDTKSHEYERKINDLYFKITCNHDTNAINNRYRLILTNITEFVDVNKQLEEAQRLSKLGSWSLDLINNKLIWSKEIYNIFEIDKDKFGASYEAFLNVIYPDDLEMVNNAYAESLKNKTPYSIKHRLLMKDGRVKWVIEQCETTFDKDNNPLISLGTVQDVTQEHEYSEQLKQKDLMLMEQSKLGALGEMIANIAHQWRQPLNVITVASSDIRIKKELNTLTEKDVDDSIKTIQDSAQYLSNTINTFTNFIKEDKTYDKLIVQNIINESLDIMSASLKDHHIELKNNLNDVNPIEIYSIASEILQVVINIINNAKDVLIERKIKNPWIQIDVSRKDDMVIITIEDNAGGIPSDIIQNIYEPYFTTKHKSQGTGLGLHMSYRIITESIKGKLYVKNSENGAKFFIELPLNN